MTKEKSRKRPQAWLRDFSFYHTYPTASVRIAYLSHVYKATDGRRHIHKMKYQCEETQMCNLTEQP